MFPILLTDTYIIYKNLYYESEIYIEFFEENSFCGSLSQKIMVFMLMSCPCSLEFSTAQTGW